MSLCSSFSSPPRSLSFFSKTRPFKDDPKPLATSRFRASADVPDFLSADWLESRKKRPFGPRLNKKLSSTSLMHSNTTTSPVKIMASRLCTGLLDSILLKGPPILGPFSIWDSLNGLGGFFIIQPIAFYLVIRIERFLAVCLWRRYKWLIICMNRFKQRVWIQGSRPEEEEIFQFTMVQRVGGSWDGYWLTESLLHDGDAFTGGLAY
ncbi:uncharacterized protein LOC121262281 isoform X1 [Juglans microcarpa x Juglans regia]|uniref:uncharacterized protein LOC121262281 isoform X1 n=1 Tax=Juglans microcarpa x Juglans regia TaxID=2249226 RepID=UPI001B7DBC49|nr:uncharacterized protein LOC121262281 isoform X1 [Juglans microcarpa x Juglans regia]